MYISRLNLCVLKYSKLGYFTLCLDESTNKIAPNIKREWYITGEYTITQINYTREKFQSFGALGNNNVFFCRFYDKPNTDSFLDFLKLLQKQFGKKLLLFADNVSYHKSQKVEVFLKKSKRKIKIIYFLPYTPELNPIEIQWRDEKKGTANQFFANGSEMKKHMQKRLDEGDVKVVNIFKYLMP